MELHMTNPAGCRKLQESTLAETVLAKTRFVANLLNGFLIQDIFSVLFSHIFIHFYFMFEKANSLYPAPQASELSGSSVYYFAEKRSKNTFLYHPVNTQ